MNLASLKTDSSIQDDTDTLGGSQRIEVSDIYNLTIDYAYFDTSPHGSMALKLQFTSDTGKKHQQALWMTGRTDKGGNNYYTQKNGERRYLAGFSLANDIALLTVGSEIGDLETQEKMVKLWDYDAKAEVPTKVPMYAELVGKKITAGMLRATVDKNTRQDDGSYVNQGETEEKVELHKVFRARDRLTRTEIVAEETESVFLGKWIEKHKGTIADKAPKAKALAANGQLAPASLVAKPAAAAKPIGSLFA